MVKLQYKKGDIIATCHPKSLGETVPQGTTPKYEDCSKLLKNNPDFIIKKIQGNYSRQGKEACEKKIQGDMIYRVNPIYFDSEFAHWFEKSKRNLIRFDLVTIKNNRLLFIELKRIKDNRMLNKNDDKLKSLAKWRSTPSL